MYRVLRDFQLPGPIEHRVPMNPQYTSKCFFPRVSSEVVHTLVERPLVDEFEFHLLTWRALGIGGLCSRPASSGTLTLVDPPSLIEVVKMFT